MGERNKYEELLNVYDLGDPRCLGWSSQDSQQTRFEAFEYFDLVQARSVLDVGSGFGDLYNFLKEKGFSGSYLGLEEQKEFHDHAQQTFDNAMFENVNFLNYSTDSKFEYVIASGLFWLKRDDWVDNFSKTIVKMWGLSEKGVGFNLLSELTPDKKESLYYPKIDWIVGEISKMTRDFVFKHDYHARSSDLTVLLVKK